MSVPTDVQKDLHCQEGLPTSILLDSTNGAKSARRGIKLRDEDLQSYC